jgi:protein N-lysine methyltransferase METTL21D
MPDENRMADVTYNTDSFPALVRTLRALISACHPLDSPLIVMGYKERDPSERSLWDMTKEIGIVLEKIGERKGCGYPPVEIWVGILEHSTKK